jgi:hypothetical protein
MNEIVGRDLEGMANVHARSHGKRHEVTKTIGSRKREDWPTFAGGKVGEWKRNE